MPRADPIQRQEYNREHLRQYSRSPIGRMRLRASFERWKERNPQKLKEMRALANRKWRLKNGHRIAACNAVNVAIRLGDLEPWPSCAMPECDERKVHAHHASYAGDARLAVTWLCVRHHKEIHRLYQ